MLPDGLWERIKPLLPPEKARPKDGRPRVSDRLALTGILFVARTGRLPLRQGESPPPSRRIQVDATEDQRQVGGLNLQTTLIHTVGRELEGARLQPLLPDRVTVLVPVKDLQAIPGLAPEDEPGSRQRVLAQIVPHHLGQRVETLPHIHRIQAEKICAVAWFSMPRLRSGCETGGKGANRREWTVEPHDPRGNAPAPAGRDLAEPGPGSVVDSQPEVGPGATVHGARRKRRLR